MKANMKIKVLRFVNYYHEYDEPIEHEIMLHAEQGHDDIMAWYGAYYAGDPYDVFINGRKISKDINGEPEAKIIDGEVRTTCGVDVAYDGRSCKWIEVK